MPPLVSDFDMSIIVYNQFCAMIKDTDFSTRPCENTVDPLFIHTCNYVVLSVLDHVGSSLTKCINVCVCLCVWSYSHNVLGLPSDTGCTGT